MRAHEFITEKQIEVPTSKKSISGVIKGQQTPYINNGVQAIVYAHNKKPNTVIKIIGITGKNDPAYQFLRVCLNHSNNPFFPKIYSYKLFNSKELSIDDYDYLENQPNFIIEPVQDKPYQLFIVTEKLKEIDANDEQLLHNMFNTIGILELLEKHTNAKNLQITFKNMFKNPNSRQLIRQTTTDKNFSQALRVLEPLFNNGAFEVDMHLGNIMLRSNDQLVINDPLAKFFTGDD